jgi:hypothetical protein
VNDEEKGLFDYDTAREMATLKENGVSYGICSPDPDHRTDHEIWNGIFHYVLSYGSYDPDRGPDQVKGNDCNHHYKTCDVYSCSPDGLSYRHRMNQRMGFDGSGYRCDENCLDGYDLATVKCGEIHCSSV